MVWEEKVGLRNVLLKQAQAVASACPRNIKWIVDEMVATTLQK